MALDLLLAYIGERRRSPVWLVILVDNHGTHTLVEIMPVDDTRHYAEFHAHARLEIPCFATPHLCQRQFKAERRFGTHDCRDFAGPVGVGASRRSFTLDRGKNILDHVAHKEAIDQRSLSHKHSL